ncbi:thiolase family protein [Haloarchaeobius sp. TZWSO28]|uniref:thiolase family protein n=1 Tax=Haloarchaeobius sp. TZWSO28 TaxID=3446119 RepID=UPI003EBC3B3F
MSVVLVDGARTPHGDYLGALASVSAIDLGATAVSGLVDRTGIDPTAIDWVVLGNAIQAGLGQVPGRQVALAAGLPATVPVTTVNEASGSGLRAIAEGVDHIAAGRGDVVVAGGFESMSNAPHTLSGLRTGRRMGDATLVDSMIRDALWDETEDAHMGVLTERLVDKFDIRRTAQDEYALESHRRAANAVESGLFDPELVPVETDDGTVSRDHGPRADTSLERLAGLPPAFGGTITAGTASDLSDGAGVVLLASEDVADSLGEPLARVVDYAVAYREPEWFGMAVADAVDDLLTANGLTPGDVAHFELNEAFAAQMLYVRDRLNISPATLNPRGGAIALGHPIGASGGMLATSLAHALYDAGERYGVVGMSIGGGGGIAMLLER